MKILQNTLRWLPIVFLTALAAAGCSQSPRGWTPGPEAIAANNRGVGLMGHFDYEGAHEVFREVVAANPGWTDARLNLAIATLNRQQPGDEAAARAIADDVLMTEPDNLRAHYIAALLKLNAGDTDAALEHFRTVASADPDDAYAAYYYGQMLMQQGQISDALDWYSRARRANPYLRSAYYGEFMARQRAGEREAAREALDAYQRLADNPRAELAEIKYTRMGSKANAVAVNELSPEEATRPEGALFAAPEEVAAFHTAPMGRTRGLTVVNMPGTTAVLVNEQDNLTALDPVNWLPLDLPFVGVSRVRAAAWGDVDNNGLVDVYLARRGPNALWKQTAAGVWEDVTATASVGGGEFDTTDAVFVDADHDGDLDILTINADGPVELFNNNLDGSFRSLAAAQGIDAGGRPGVGLATADLDADRDVDLIVLHERPPHSVFLNDRLWQYREAEGFDAFKDSEARAVAVADVDADGRVELYTLSGSRVLVWRRDGDAGWRSETVLSGREGRELALADVSGDGRQDLLLMHADGWLAADVRSGEVLFEGSQSLEGWTLLNTDPARGPSLLGFTPEQRLVLWPPGPGRFAFMALRFSGREDTGESMRSNASGIGTHVAVRVGSRWSTLDTFRQGSGPGQDLQPLLLGLGGATSADYIAIDWSDGVFQTELDLEPGEAHAITETQRQLASCPVLFVWNGEGFVFVSDLLGVGGIGFNTGAGVYSTPRPWENFQLPPGLLQPRNDRLHLKITEPMEEIAYVDSVALVAYDVPEAWDLVLDERLGTSAPAPTGEPRWYREVQAPRRAVNDRGGDVTAAVRHRDDVAAPVGERDPRFLGLLADEHVLTLEFDAPLGAGSGEPLLLMEGWVEYGYSQTGFAAWQAGVNYQPPTLEYRDSSGQWRVLHATFGYPAGMPRRGSVPLNGIPAGTRALRLRTNQEIYWDRLAVARAEALPQIVRHELVLAEATVNKAGFPERLRLAQRRPHYEYASRNPFWDTRYPEGFYTALGPARELVAASDSALAIIGPGEEVHLEFSAPDEPPAPGYRRHFVLETRGWAKDMDLYTRDGETVAPLPVAEEHRDLDSGRREELHARYNWRFQAGR